MRREQKWIQAILRRNSREAVEKLIDAYYDDIYGYAYRQIGNREDALDVTQDIFIASLRSLAAFDDRDVCFVSAGLDGGVAVYPAVPRLDSG